MVFAKKISQACMSCSVSRELMLKEVNFPWQRCFVACALEMPQNRTEPFLDLEHRLWDQFMHSSCEKKTNFTTLKERRENLEALVMWLDLYANSLQSLQFKFDLIQHFIEIGSGQNVVGLGVGSSENIVFLSVLFCKVIAIDLYPESAASQRLSNVIHLHQNSSKESWRVFLQSELVDTIVMDARRLTSEMDDLVAALNLLHRAPRPRLVFHGYNLPGVRAAIDHFIASGTLYECVTLGLNLTAAEARETGADLFNGSHLNVAPFAPWEALEGPFPEGLLCRVEKTKASDVSRDADPHFARQSPQHFDGREWYLFNASDTNLPYGTLQLFERQTDSDGVMFLTDKRDNKRWWATWHWDRHNSSFLRVSIRTGARPQNGTVMFNKARTALIVDLHDPSITALAPERTGWIHVPSAEVFREVGAKLGQESTLPFFLGPYPVLKIFGISRQVLDREFNDVQAEYEVANSMQSVM